MNFTKTTNVNFDLDLDDIAKILNGLSRSDVKGLSEKLNSDTKTRLTALSNIRTIGSVDDLVAVVEELSSDDFKDFIKALDNKDISYSMLTELEQLGYFSDYSNISTMRLVDEINTLCDRANQYCNHTTIESVLKYCSEDSKVTLSKVLKWYLGTPTIDSIEDVVNGFTAEEMKKFINDLSFNARRNLFYAFENASDVLKQTDAAFKNATRGFTDSDLEYLFKFIVDEKFSWFNDETQINFVKLVATLFNKFNESQIDSFVNCLDEKHSSILFSKKYFGRSFNADDIAERLNNKAQSFMRYVFSRFSKNTQKQLYICCQDAGFIDPSSIVNEMTYDQLKQFIDSLDESTTNTISNILKFSYEDDSDELPNIKNVIKYFDTFTDAQIEKFSNGIKQETVVRLLEYIIKRGDVEISNFSSKDFKLTLQRIVDTLDNIDTSQLEFILHRIKQDTARTICDFISARDDLVEKAAPYNDKNVPCGTSETTVEDTLDNKEPIDNVKVGTFIGWYVKDKLIDIGVVVKISGNEYAIASYPTLSRSSFYVYRNKNKLNEMMKDNKIRIIDKNKLSNRSFFFKW